MTHPPSAPPNSPHDAAEVELLLQFVRERDVDCPGCGYNLRNLTTPVCPECQEGLSLRIGMRTLRLYPLLLTLAPCMFCAIVVLILIIGTMRWGPPRFRGDDWLLVAFFVISGLAAVILAMCYKSFIRMPAAAQTVWVVSAWLVHIMVLIIVMFR